jgi:outer membrane lipoprotein-sorting protein
LPQGTEEFSGRFTASSSGNFRIDYIEPEPQTVVKKFKRTILVFQNRNLLFYQEENQKNPLSALDIFSEISSVIKENIAVKYCGFSYMVF